MADSVFQMVSGVYQDKSPALYLFNSCFQIAQIAATSRRSCPFHKRSLSLLRHLENFWRVIESFSIKKKENRNPGSNLDLVPGPLVC